MGEKITQVLEKAGGASWRTSASGIVAALTVLLASVKLALDGHFGDINFIQACEAVGALALAFGLVQARDKNVTSEKQGAR